MSGRNGEIEEDTWFGSLLEGLHLNRGVHQSLKAPV